MADPTGRPGVPGHPGSDDRVRLPLLTLITQQSLDGDYLVAAERRAAGASRPPRGRPQRTAAIVIAVFGVLVSTAAVQTERNADVADESRTTLIRRIEGQRAQVSRQQERVAGLTDQTTDAERRVGALAEDVQAVELANRRLQVVTGFVPVRGEGVRFTITQVEDPDPNQEVKDFDLALVANGLWEAGAEAISINGQRLTAETAIRSSGLAIEVNAIGIAPPYTVLAIGDQLTLSANFFDTSTGLAFAATADGNDIGYDVDNVDELSLPAGPERFLRLRSVDTDALGVLPSDGPGTGPDDSTDDTEEGSP